MTLKTGIICKNCGYDLNSKDAEKCEVCNHSLKNSSIFAGKLFTPKPLKPLSNWGLPIVAVIVSLASLTLIWKASGIQFATSNVSAVKSSMNNCNLFDVGFHQTTYTQICYKMRNVENVPSGRFFYSATADTEELRSQSVVDSIANAQPNFRPTYLDSPFAPGDSDSAIESVIAGEASFAVSLNPISANQYKSAPTRGVILKQIPVATVNIVFYTNPLVGVKSLSVKQLQAIYTGKITNWKQVGGADLAIVPVVQTSDAQPNSFLLRGQAGSVQHFGNNNTVEVGNLNEALSRIKSTPGAISYACGSKVVGQDVNVIGITKGSGNNLYPLMRRVYVVLHLDNDLDEAAGRAYVNLLLSDEGQKLIEQVGYLPIR